jgi:hypothetical protein
VPLALLFLSNRALNPALVLAEVALNTYVLWVNRAALPQVWRRVLPVTVGLAPGVLLGTLIVARVSVLRQNSIGVVSWRPPLRRCPFLALWKQQGAANGRKGRHKAKAENRRILRGMKRDAATSGKLPQGRLSLLFPPVNLCFANIATAAKHPRGDAHRARTKMVRLPTTLTTMASRRPRGQSSDTVVRRSDHVREH